ncbi:hypothetical protein IEQ34_020191 [Dendrobium chrysotoxum]|uniref:Uncharacterized protein n=1 Tax=Dendrobium chrysotoxum TaxID=161865 RepID=A0AAV7G090_DENCH|nr:hypothetical protein IEQ34_020191 [Dendrobium chrysotoxum]
MGEALISSSVQEPNFYSSLDKFVSMFDVAEKLVAEMIEKETNMPILWVAGHRVLSEIHMCLLLFKNLVPLKFLMQLVDLTIHLFFIDKGRRLEMNESVPHHFFAVYRCCVPLCIG